MNKQKYTAAAILGGAILLFLVWWFALAEKATSPSPTSSHTSPSTTVNQGASATVPSTNAPSGNASSTNPPIVDSKAAIIQSIMDSRNAKSLDFYGKVIDQNNQAVSDVKVTARVGLYISITHSGGKHYETRSDSAGNFRFVGIHGAGTGFTLEKDGYIYDQSQASSSRPNDYIPDPNNPVVFRMWRLKGAEPMTYAEVHASVPCDGTSASFNLLTGRPKGDLTVTLTRNPINIDRSKPFDWTLTIGVTNGGIVANNDTYPNEAPTEGYQQSITIEMPRNAKDWTPTVSGSYYIKSGQTYGRMTIGGMANFQPAPTAFDADIYLNPSGSRNLEFDWRKQINQ
jgi:hypothetical protein